MLDFHSHYPGLELAQERLENAYIADSELLGHLRDNAAADREAVRLSRSLPPSKPESVPPRRVPMSGAQMSNATGSQRSYS